MKTRIAIFTTPDRVWSLPAWSRTVPLLQKDHEVVGICLFPESLGKIKGLGIYWWYLRVFGLFNLLMFGLYGLKTEFRTRKAAIRTWKELSAKFEVPLLRAASPNSEEIIRWTKDNRVDVLFIMISQILKSEIVGAPKLGIINKHAAVLPSCGGIFPYFWGRLKGEPTGITFYRVDEGIDSGEVILQIRHPAAAENISMLRFYMDVFAIYPAMAVEALERLLSGNLGNTIDGVSPSYYSLPSPADYRAFRANHHAVARLSDLFYEPGRKRWKLPTE